MPKQAIEEDSDDDQDESTPTLPISVSATIHASYAEFADAYIKTGDATKSYLVTHPDCNSASRAKKRGREILARPDVQAYIQGKRAQLLDSSGIDAAKLAWQAEVRSIAFARVPLKKVPIKEKNAALRTYGEAMGFLKAQNQGAGIRATFNFRLAGGAQVGDIMARRRDQVVSVDVDTDPDQSPPASGFDVPAVDGEISTVRVAQQPDNGFNTSPSPSPNTTTCAEVSQPPADARRPRATVRQRIKQVADSKGNAITEGQKQGQARASTTPRSRLLDRSGGSVSPGNPPKPAKPSLFDRFNT